MNTLIMSTPIFILFLYGFFNIMNNSTGKEGYKLTKTGTVGFNGGAWLAKGWILAVMMLMLILSITGL